MFKEGDVLCVRTTGERVCFLEALATGARVRRAVVTDGGRIEHVDETVFGFELETLREHAERQCHEMLMKAKVQKELLDTQDDKAEPNGNVIQMTPKVN